MRNQLLLITTILLVGTVGVSALAFYQSPNKQYALFGEPEDVNSLADTGSVVAGVESQKLPESFPKDIPLFVPSLIVSHSETLSGSQLTLKTEESLLKVSHFYADILTLNGWVKGASSHYNNTQTLNFSKDEKRLAIKVSSSIETEETIITLLYSFVPTK